MAIGDLSNATASLAAATAVNIQPTAGINKRVLAVTTTPDNQDVDSTPAVTFRMFLFDGTTRGFIGGDVWPSANTLSARLDQTLLLIDNANYLRLYNAAVVTQTYNVQMVEMP